MMQTIFKRVLSFALALLLVLSLVPVSPLQVSAEGTDAGSTADAEMEATGTISEEGGKTDEAPSEVTELSGEGTEESPYLVNNLEELEFFRDDVNAGNTYSGKHVKLTGDIDLNNEEWTPIGTAGAPFQGTFDGDDHTISNLKIAHPGGQTVVNNVGLFGKTQGANIKNLTVKNANVTGSGYVAAVVGNFFTGTMTNVSLTGNIQIAGYQYVGGLIGWGYASVNNCQVIGDSTDTSMIKKVARSEIYGFGTNGYVGGITGWIGEGNSKITGCKVQAVTITTNDDTVGGISGIFHYGNSFTDCQLVDVVITAPDNDGYNGIIAGHILTSAGSENTYSVTVSNVSATAGGVELKALGSHYSGPLTENSTDNVLSGTVYNKADVVAKIGDTYYKTLAEAVEAAKAGDTITLLTDVELTEALEIGKDQVITLDLNGNTISCIKDCTAAFGMIVNNGNLTINDSIGGGKISFTDTGVGDPEFGWGSYTITNTGTLTVNGGTLENLSQHNSAAGVNHMYCVIQQAGGTVTIHDGATISNPTYRSVRVNRGALFINGGIFEGQIWMQPFTEGTSIVVNGGSFKPTGPDGSSIYIENSSKAVSVAISGGTFNTKIGCANAAALSGCITGGTFTESAKNNTNAALLAEGFVFQQDENGSYGVKEDPAYGKVAKIGDTYYESLAVALTAAQEGQTIVLLQNVKLTGKLTITKGITIDGNGYSIIADETAVWYTVSGKLNTKNYKTHLIGVNANGITLKNVTLDCNNNAAGINIYCAQNVVFDNVQIINATKGMAALTVNGSTLAIKNKFSALGNSIALDISNGSGVTSALGVTVEAGAVFDLGNKTVKFASVAVNDMYGAVDANGNLYFVAYDSGYFYTKAQMESRTTAYSNGLTLMTDVELSKDVEIKGTLNLNGNDLTLAEGKVLKVSNKLTVTGEGELNAAVVLTKVAATLTGPEGLKVTTTVDGYMVKYENGIYRVANVAAKIEDTYYESLAAALTAAQDGDTITLIWTEGDAPIAMNGAVFGKTVTITGTAIVDWSKDFLFIGRGGAGNGTIIFENANLTSASNSASYGIHVSGREKNTDNKYDGTLVIKNSVIELDYLINKGAMTLDNSTLTVKNGFSIGGRPASETESGMDATATLNLTNGSKVIVNNHNGMGLGYEAIGVMNIDATSGFETTQSFLITAKGTMNVAGTVKVAGILTNEGTLISSGDITGTIQNNGGKIEISGGKYTTEIPADWCAEGCVACYNADETAYIVGKLPEAEVTDLTVDGPLTIKGGEYSIFNGNGLVESTEDLKLPIALQFNAKDSVDQAKANAFGYWNTDFYIALNGVNGEIDLTGCYLIGNYGKFGWIAIPLEGAGVQGNTVYPVLGTLNQDWFEYWEICADVKEFKCGIYLTEEVLDAHPDLEVTLELHIAPHTINAGVNDLNYIKIGETFRYTVEDLDMRVYVAQVGETKYETLAEALKAARSGDTVTLLQDVTGDVIVNKSIVLDGNGHTVTGKVSVSGSGITVKNLKVENAGGNAMTVSGGNILIENCEISGNNGLRNCYANNGNVTIKDCIVTGNTYGIHFDGGNGEGKVVIEGCTVTGWTSFGSAVEGITIQDTKFAEGNYNYIRFYQSAEIDGCIFNEKMGVDVNDSITGAKLTISNSVVENGNIMDIITLDDAVRNDVYIDGEKITVVATVTDSEGEVSYYLTLTEAVKEAKAGDTITLLTDVELAEALVIGKDQVITLDLNGKTLSYTSDIAGEDMITNRGDLTITGEGTITYCNTDTTGSNVTVSTISSEAGSKLTVLSGTIANTSEARGSSGIYAYAIDALTNGNLGAVTVNINGGKITSNYMAIRLFNNSKTDLCTLNITGGEIYGDKRAVQIHLDNATSVLNISGGKIAAGEDGYALCSFSTDGAYLITGGEFTGWVYSSAQEIISGGTYSYDVTENCVEGYMAEQIAEGVWGIDTYIALNVNTGKKYDTVYQALMEAYGTGATIKLVNDSNEMGVMVPAGVTLDLNGNTLTVMMITAIGNVVDNSEGRTGFLAVTKGNVVLSANNPQLPVYNGNGYYFTTIDLDTNALAQEQSNGSMKLWSKPLADEKTTALLADGAANNGLTFALRIYYSDANGSYSMDVEIYDSNIAKVFSSTDWFFVGVNNWNDFNYVAFSVVVKSDTGVAMENDNVVVVKAAQ